MSAFLTKVSSSLCLNEEQLFQAIFRADAIRAIKLFLVLIFSTDRTKIETIKAAIKL